MKIKIILSKEDIKTAISLGYQYVMSIQNEGIYAYNGNPHQLFPDYDDNNGKFIGCPINEAIELFFN